MIYRRTIFYDYNVESHTSQFNFYTLMYRIGEFELHGNERCNRKPTDIWAYTLQFFKAFNKKQVTNI